MLSVQVLGVGCVYVCEFLPSHFQFIGIILIQKDSEYMLKFSLLLRSKLAEWQNWFKKNTKNGIEKITGEKHVSKDC